MLRSLFRKRGWRIAGWLVVTALTGALLIGSIFVAVRIDQAQSRSTLPSDERTLPFGVFMTPSAAAALESLAPGREWTAHVVVGDETTLSSLSYSSQRDPYQGAFSPLEVKISDGSLSTPMQIVFELPSGELPDIGNPSFGVGSFFSLFGMEGGDEEQLSEGETYCARWVLAGGEAGRAEPVIDHEDGVRDRWLCEIPALGEFEELWIGAETVSHDAVVPTNFAGRGSVGVVALSDPVALSTDKTDVSADVESARLTLLSRTVDDRIHWASFQGGDSQSPYLQKTDLSPGEYTAISLVDTDAYSTANVALQVAWVALGLASGWLPLAMARLYRAVFPSRQSVGEAAD